MTNINRKLFSKIRSKLPLHLDSVEDYYFLAFSISAISCLIILAPILSYAGQSRSTWSSILCAILLSCYLALWRIGTPIPHVQVGYQVTLMWCILYNAYYSGGVMSPVMVWMGIVPILPLFTVSRRWSYAWLLISFISVIAMYVAQMMNLVPPPPSGTPKQILLSAIMIGTLCFTQIILVITYDYANSQTVRYISRKNETLEKLSQDLQSANIHKDQFLATVSHEMRTPLNAIMGYLGLLKTSQDIPATAASYVQGAQNSAAHLLTVINDLLDFSQIKNGKLIFTPQTVNLHQVIIETHQTLAPTAAEKQIKYSLHLEPTLPEWVQLDPHRFKQIFLNLLGNAIKFTNEGIVYTHALYISDEKHDKTGTLIIKVEDSGIGIPLESMNKVFEPFVQLDQQNNLQSDSSLRGNGLGLSITKSLVNNLGGNISISSKVGKGSIFEVALPIVEENIPPIPFKEQIIASKNHQEKIYILIVDDHATNRLVAAATIKRSLPNAQIDEARNGTEAIQKMNLNHYDLVLMDLLMPDFSGIEVVRKIRSESKSPFCDVKVVALTANVAEDAAIECLNVGILKLLPKPFDREVLIRTILEHIVR